MADSVQVKLDGFDVLAQRLREIVPAMRKRVVRNALSAGARLVRDEAKRTVPVLQRVTNKYRKPGTVRDNIRVRTSKRDRQAGDVGVFVNVKAPKGTLLGAKSPNDPYYWRFLELRTRKMRARPFLVPGSKKLPQALTIFQTQVGKWFAKIDAEGKVTP